MMELLYEKRQIKSNRVLVLLIVSVHVILLDYLTKKKGNYEFRRGKYKGKE